MAVYVRIEDVPLDEYSVPDIGDEESINSPHGTEFGITAVEQMGIIPANHPKKVPPHYIIPFERTLGLGSSGHDVVGAKRAIWKANHLPIPIHASESFGVLAVKQLKTFQKTHHLQADGVLGPATLKVLGPYFDALAYFLYVGYPPGATKQKQIVSYCYWGYNNRGAIGYAEFRPMIYMHDLYHLPMNEDCSTFATKSYEFGKAQDPNRMNYDGYGNTYEMRKHGTQVSVANCLPGDLAHYDNPQHVGVVVTGGSNARVIEHGSGIGPCLLPINYRTLTFVMRYVL
jgi:hypothetical protein